MNEVAQSATSGIKLESLNGAISAAKVWYNGLQPRERQLLLLAVSVLLVLALYFLIWRPFNNSLDSLRSGVETAKSNLAYMQEAQSKVEALKPVGKVNAPNLNGQSILTVVESTREANKIPAFKRIESDSKNGVRITIDGAPFDSMILWIGRLKRQYGLTVSDIILDNMEESGKVNVKLILAAPAS